MQGVPARQYDAFQIGMVTSDDFTNADIIYEEALPQIRAAFNARKDLREVPIVTGEQAGTSSLRRPCLRSG